jgi:hypothetical protein
MKVFAECLFLTCQCISWRWRYLDMSGYPFKHTYNFTWWVDFVLGNIFLAGTDALGALGGEFGGLKS